MKTLPPIAFIGDVHGWLERVDALIDRLPSNAHLIFLGDLIDRGPDSAGVISRVRGLCESGRASCILGNHEYALIRALGCESLGIVPQARPFSIWYRAYGGAATAASYGIERADASALRAAMGDDLDWLARLPWYLAGQRGEQGFIAVHAGLGTEPVQGQLAALDNPERYFHSDAGLPTALYLRRITEIPCDLPEGWDVVSGHTAMEHALIRPGRIMCDTSGGEAGHPLTAVLWPMREPISAYAPSEQP